MLNSQNVIIVTILIILGSFNLICNKLTIRINLYVFSWSCLLRGLLFTLKRAFGSPHYPGVNMLWPPAQSHETYLSSPCVKGSFGLCFLLRQCGTRPNALQFYMRAIKL